MSILSRGFRSQAGKRGPKRVLVVTDPGRDPDDEVLFTQLAGLTRLGYAQVAGIIVNQTPLAERAQFAKATFKAMGLADVPVAIGTEGDVTHKLRDYEFNAPYLTGHEEVAPDGQAFLKEQMEKAQREGVKVTLLLVSGMKDADIFIKAHSELAKATLESVQIMGGIEIGADQKPVLDKNGFLQPDNAANNKFGSHENEYLSDPISKYARSLYATLQEQGIPTTVLTRHAAYEARVAGSYYTKLAETGHPVGVRLRDMQKTSLLGLFEDVTQPGGHPNARLTPEWFANTFLKDPQNDLQQLLKNPDDIMDRVKGFNPYDPMTALSTFFPDLFKPYAHGKGSMSVIGLSPAEHGVVDVEGVRKLLEFLPRAGFGLEPEQALQTALAAPGTRNALPKKSRRFEA